LGRESYGVEREGGGVRGKRKKTTLLQKDRSIGGGVPRQRKRGPRVKSKYGGEAAFLRKRVTITMPTHQ